MPTATPPPANPDDALGCWTSNPQSLVDSCILPQMVGAFGGSALFGLLLAGTVLGTLWIAGDMDIVPPAVMLILFGGILFPILPAGYRGMAYSILVVSVAAVAYGIQRNQV